MNLAVARSVTFALFAACQMAPVEVARPFYLMPLKDPWQVMLLRCPDGPGKGVGCAAVEGLPGTRVVAAGADTRYVVVAQAPSGDGPIRYYYFARIPQERAGWGNNPERIVGPLNQDAFDAAKARLHLPDFTATP